MPLRKRLSTQRTLVNLYRLVSYRTTNASLRIGGYISVLSKRRLTNDYCENTDNVFVVVVVSIVLLMSCVSTSPAALVVISSCHG